MSVCLKLSPTLQKYVAGYDERTGLIVEHAAGRKIRELIEELCIPSEEVSSIIVNYRPSRASYVVNEGDLISLHRVLGGG
jgi:hypothetical protein